MASIAARFEKDGKCLLWFDIHMIGYDIHIYIYKKWNCGRNGKLGIQIMNECVGGWRNF